MKNIQNFPSCEECIAKDHPVFKDLTPEQLDNVNYDKACNIYKRGMVVFQEGHRINGFYCVFSGILKLYKTGIDGKEQIIRFAKDTDIIGYRSILSSELACTTAKVIEDATICYIPGDQLHTLVTENPAFAMKLMQLTCKELGEANNYITDIAQKTVRERLAEILLLLKERFDLDENQVLQISLTREELANIVGTATESVIRLLSEFKQDRLIELQGRKIKILNIAGLKKIASF
ncbi:MAG: Crp/Fnr family transcriptional regulator [Bacteroidales bacterium]|nr:Crp/Fnr family transcriptional regulator [Bacteroidales bacterium]